MNPAAAEGLRAVSFQEALTGFEHMRSQNLSGVRPVQAFAFADSPAKLTLEAERRKPQVTVAQMFTARVEPGVIKYEATFYYDILFSGVRSLRIDLPEAVASKAHNDTPGVREGVITPAPDDVAEGDVAWSLAGESEFLGRVVIKLSWESPLDKLDVGSSVEVSLPHLKPREVDRAWGQITLVKAEAIDLHESGEPEGVRPIDPQHDLMPGVSVPGAARAFEFHEDWTLAVTATRYKLEEVKHTSIERAVVRAVVTRSEQTSVQALYQLRSAEQRLPIVLPEGTAFDTEPLRINGKSVTLESGEPGQYFVPLVGQDPDKPFLLELRYTLAKRGTTFDLPTFTSSPAVQKVYLCAYLPEEWAVRSRRRAVEPTRSRGGGDRRVGATAAARVRARADARRRRTRGLGDRGARRADESLRIVPEGRPAAGVFDVASRPGPGRLAEAGDDRPHALEQSRADDGRARRRGAAPQARRGSGGRGRRGDRAVGAAGGLRADASLRDDQQRAVVGRGDRRRDLDRRLVRAPQAAHGRDPGEARAAAGRHADRATGRRTAAERAAAPRSPGIGRCGPWLVAASSSSSPSSCCAARLAPPTSPPPPRPTREIYVPFDQLDVLLEGPTRRVLMSREEFDALLKQARRSPTDAVPQEALLLAADYDLKIDNLRAEITARLTCEVLADGLHALSLDLADVGIREAKLDGRAAPRWVARPTAGPRSSSREKAGMKPCSRSSRPWKPAPRSKRSTSACRGSRPRG